jgi:hypothetical protein
MQRASGIANDVDWEAEGKGVDLSQHALARSSQRGIRPDVIDLILEHGSKERRPGGAIELHLNKRDKTRMVAALKRRIRIIEQAAGKAVLMADDGKIITVYNRL